MTPNSKKKWKKPISNAKNLIDLAKTRRKLRAAKRKEQHKATMIEAWQEMKASNLVAIPNTTRVPQPEGPAFPNFMKLPAEIRIKIWEFSLPGSRIFEPLIDDKYYGSAEGCMGLHHKFPPPASRGICKEAWNITEQHGMFCMGSHRWAPMDGCWFNPRRDVVYLSSKWKHSLKSEANLKDFLDRFLLPPRVEHVALSWEFL